MKTAIYCRVSTKEQNTDNQQLRLVEYCKRNEYEFEVFEEQESTRKTRPIKYALMQRLRNKEFDAVLVWKIDRWARSTIELLNDIEELHTKGINFISIQDNIDLSTSAGKLQFQIMCAFAEFERSIIRERTMLGLERAKSEGKVLGRPKNSKDSKPRRKSGYWLRYADKKGTQNGKQVA
jgi:putative DNA-invertase from lambdoid prophage Rac